MPEVPLLARLHVGFLVGMLAVVAGLLAVRRRLAGHPLAIWLRYAVATLLLLSVIGPILGTLRRGLWTVVTDLPLQLCDLASLLIAYALVRPRRWACEPAYFWGVGGSVPTLCTPDLQASDALARMLLFFCSHAAIITGAVMLPTLCGWRPQRASVRRAFLLLNAYIIVMSVVNLGAHANYGYLCAKPGARTLITYLGPWPWYIISLESIALFMFWMAYLPFAMSGASVTLGTLDQRRAIR